MQSDFLSDLDVLVLERVVEVIDLLGRTAFSRKEIDVLGEIDEV